LTSLPARRFPPPWTIQEYNDACFIVSDHNGHALAYVYFEEEPGRRAAANLLTKDEARQIAATIAKLSEAKLSELLVALKFGIRLTIW
jgi:hypothetical protein